MHLLPDPVSLRHFVAVMEEGTIAGAAAREHIAASAISKRLAELEGTLGTRLFARSNRGTVPTAAAYALLGRARESLAGLESIVTQMGDYASGLRGQVRIDANMSAITQFLPRELQGFLQRYPQVQIHLQERVSSAIARSVAEHAADVGVLNPGQYGEPLTFLPYHRDELVVVLPAGHALARRRALRLADVLDHDLVGSHPGSFIVGLLVQGAAAQGRTLRMRIQVTSYDAMCVMVAAGLGLGIMPRRSAELFLPALPLRCVRLDETWARRQLVLAVRDPDALSPAARLLVQHLQAQVQGASPAMAGQPGPGRLRGPAQ